jgi:hypothetical protein
VDAGLAGVLLAVSERTEVSIDDVVLIGGGVGLDAWGDRWS